MNVYNKIIREYAEMEDDGRQYRTCDRDGRNPKVVYPDHESALRCAAALEDLNSAGQYAYQCEVDPTHHHLTRRDTQGQCACQRAA
jgi:hypothetical protein